MGSSATICETTGMRIGASKSEAKVKGCSVRAATLPRPREEFKYLREAPTLLHIERSMLRWLGHLIRMPPTLLLGEVFQACPTGRRSRGRRSTHCRDYFSAALVVPTLEVEEVARTGRAEHVIRLLSCDKNLVKRMDGKRKGTKIHIFLM